MYRLRYFLVATLTVLLADQFSKRWATSFLESRSCGEVSNCSEVFGGVQLRLLFNEGAAFSTGVGFGRWFALGAVLVLVFLLFLAWRRTTPLQGIVLGLVAGGAAGNLYDRILRADSEGLGTGAVVDFIDIGPWPVFNLADAAITVGAVALVFIGFDEPGKSSPVLDVPEAAVEAEPSGQTDLAATSTPEIEEAEVEPEDLELVVRDDLADTPEADG